MEQHRGRRGDDVDRKFLFMYDDAEEQKDELDGRNCKIRLKMGQTT